MVRNWVAEVKYYLFFSFLFIVLLSMYGWVLNSMGIIPIGGKKAPTYVFLLFFQWYYVTRYPKRNQGEKLPFMIYFLLQYLLILSVAFSSAFFLYYFFQTPAGVTMLEAYIQQSLGELNAFKQIIVGQEGGEYYNRLHAGVKSIDAYSIAKDDFAQKIALGFLPNLLLSLYYKK